MILRSLNLGIECTMLVGFPEIQIKKEQIKFCVGHVRCGLSLRWVRLAYGYRRWALSSWSEWKNTFGRHQHMDGIYTHGLDKRAQGILSVKSK